MKAATVVGILLIILGVVSLALGGFSFTTQEKKKVVDLGPLQVDATVQKERSVPLPPLLGGLALAGGIVLVVVGNRK